MTTRPHIPHFSSLTTLRVGGPPEAYIEAADEAEVVAAVSEADEPILVVAGGSNLLVADEGFEGTAVHIRSSGLEIRGTEVTAAAGQSWDELVATTVDSGLTGIEFLSGIPGTVGATPIQNVGAYDQQVADTIVSVRAYDPSQGRIVEIPGDECGFDYRTSHFQRDDRVVLSVTYRLERAELCAPIRYEDLLTALDIKKGEQVPLADARRAVIAVRAEKGMIVDEDDRDSVSAGSFFKNPLLDPDSAARLQRVAGIEPIKEDFPRADGLRKFSAAQLILAAGFAKGYRGPGSAHLSNKHVLALVNGGGASAQDLVALARQVRAAVSGRFHIDLHPEPTLVGVTI
jgi:UDP-N-acetylmuramate dehydrogenase